MDKVNYEKVKKIVGDLFEEYRESLCRVSIDVFDLTNKMGIKLKKATDVVKSSTKKALEFQDINKEKEIFGFSFFDNTNQNFVIYVNDMSTNLHKQRFSLAHEIGHIVLEHYTEKNRSIEIIEKEADYFAGYLLCPECIGLNENIYKALGNKPGKLSKIFGISLDTALIKCRYIYNRANMFKDICSYEKTILECIEQPIINKIKK